MESSLVTPALVELLAGRIIMKQILRPFCCLLIVLALFAPALADTIRLKDGSVIRGQVIAFKDQQFTVLIGSGAQGRRSRTTIYVEDIESIEFDSATTAAASALANEDTATTASSTAPVYQPPRNNPPPDTSNNPPPRVSNQTLPSSSPTFFTIKVAVRADNANNGWSNSGLVVRKGQRLRITATGRVSLGGNRFATPAGIPGTDNDKLMRTEPTGALIAVIGDDNDDFLLIGTRRDFVAQRDGVLFLGVNEGNLADNTGTYDVVIEAEAGGGPR
ncbi:MAG TPA: hypothetical protein DC047_01355 [Blastocatellia bacterium]|nr:hypothetical protein [Blastocatellia bacterium]